MRSLALFEINFVQGGRTTHIQNIIDRAIYFGALGTLVNVLIGANWNKTMQGLGRGVKIGVALGALEILWNSYNNN